MASPNYVEFFFQVGLTIFTCC